MLNEDQENLINMPGEKKHSKTISDLQEGGAKETPYHQGESEFQMNSGTSSSDEDFGFGYEGGAESGANMSNLAAAIRKTTENLTTDGDDKDMRKEDSDDEEGYSIEHMYVDFRQVFLQAHLQNILGKPKYQVIHEKLNKHDESTLILKRFYEKEGFTTKLETTQIVSLIYEDY